MDGSLIEKITQLRRCCERIQRGVDDKAQVTEAQCAFLQALSYEGTMLTGELCRRAGLSPSRGSRVIDELVRAGWVERQTDPGDRRVTLVGITELGRARKQEVDTLLGDCERAIVERLTPEQLQQVESGLALLQQAMEDR